MPKRKKRASLPALVILLLLIAGGSGLNNALEALPLPDALRTVIEQSPFARIADSPEEGKAPKHNSHQRNVKSLDIPGIPPYQGTPFVAINNNHPDFSPSDFSEESFEEYSELDSLGRCGPALANVGRDIMPTEKRGPIGQIKPSGWHTVKYDIIDKKYLYNRCHLIGYQLTGENANPQNLITGTRYLNVEGMLPFENRVAEYVKRTGNHVLYRVTPIFRNDNLLADGVQIEAMSVEDKGRGISFNVFCYNVQPGITIDYSTGHSRLDGK